MKTDTQESIYRDILRAELEKRCDKNPGYSLRAYAQSLNLNPATLSLVLNGKSSLSFKMAKRVIDSIDLEPEESKAFLNSVVIEQKSRELKRKDPKVTNFESEKAKLSSLSVDYYKLISEWYYIAILELTFVSDFKDSPKWVASQLGISEIEAKLAIERLIDLGLLEITDSGLKKSEEQLRLQDMYTATGAARKKRQKQIREKAIEAIDSQSISKRSMTTMTFATDPSRIDGARKIIQEFNEKLLNYLEQGEKKEVYTLEVGLFSLQK